MHYFAYKSFKNFLREDPQTPFFLIYIISSQEFLGIRAAKQW